MPYLKKKLNVSFFVWQEYSGEHVIHTFSGFSNAAGIVTAIWSSHSLLYGTELYSLKILLKFK